VELDGPQKHLRSIFFWFKNSREGAELNALIYKESALYGDANPYYVVGVDKYWQR